MKIIDQPRDKIHVLKTWPKYFQSIKHGFKTFEIRRDDRNFQLGDYLELKEWNPDEEKYTGDKLLKRVNYIMWGPIFGLEKGFVIMGIVDDLLGPITGDLKR